MKTKTLRASGLFWSLLIGLGLALGLLLALSPHQKAQAEGTHVCSSKTQICP